MPPDPDVEAWITALQERHRRDLTTPEFLRAVRALSARYVESRSRLDRGRAADTPGKRAAFAAFYAPLHYFTVRAIVDALGATAPALDPLLDVGCGTGAASAAWATVLPGARIAGVDRDPWMPTEAHWTWRQMGLRGAARTGDAVRALAPLPSARRRVRRPWGCVLAWTANELAALGADDKGAGIARLQKALRQKFA